MAGGPSVAVLRDIQSLFDTGTLNGLSDRQLLERFAGRRDASSEAAFEVLVLRHGPMVLRVCRNVLGDSTDAEDAFQATFLVLVRRCGSIRRLESLGSWLYGVACRVAARAASTPPSAELLKNVGLCGLCRRSMRTDQGSRIVPNSAR